MSFSQSLAVLVVIRFDEDYEHTVCFGSESVFYSPDSFLSFHVLFPVCSVRSAHCSEVYFDEKVVCTSCAIV